MRISLRLALVVGLVFAGGIALPAQTAAPAARTGRGGVEARAPASGKGFIWSINGKGQTGWLVGSLHLLPPDAYPLPASMDAAFQAAEILVEEADPDELSAPETAAEVLKRAFFPPGQSLEGSVSPATFKTLSERAAKAGVPVQVLQQMRPWMVAVTLAGLEMQKSGFDPALGLDRHFRERARTASKPLRTVESVMEQIGMLESLGPALQEALAVESLRGASSEVDQAQALFAAWKAGDGPSMEKVLVDGTKTSPDIYRLLFVERNRRWVPKIEACLAGARCMIVVGAGHLVGPDGLIALLRARGYTVAQR
jgi:uncharacterized protein